MHLPTKELQFGKEARTALQAGVNKLANAVRETMGPRGRNVVIEKGYGSPYITKDGVTVAKEVDLKDPFENLGAQMLKEVASRTGDQAGDGPQPLYSKVLTPAGFTNMGTLKVGDEICGTNSTVQKVEGVFPKGEKEILKVYIAGGKVVECCEDHLWGITTDYGKQKVLTVKEMEALGLFKENGKGDIRYRFYTPRTSVAFNRTDASIDPYLMGVLLGDGSLSSASPKNGEIELSLGFKKEHILGKIRMPEGFTLDVTRVDSKNYLRVKIKGRGVGGQTFHALLREIGLLGTKSDTKFIPKEYLFNDEGSRRRLLQGLLDTDGHVNARGKFEFSTVSHALKVDFVDLCYSLGIPLNIKVQDRSQDEGSYSDRPIFRITELKGDKYGDKIVKIERTGEMTEMRCIKVSNPDNLYITDGYAVTHNTTTATVLAQAIVNEGMKYLEAGASPIEIKRGIDFTVDKLVAALSVIARPVKNKAEIAQVGAISANNEKEIGDIIAEAMDKVGMDGVITVEESRTADTYLSVEDGMQINCGYQSHAYLPANSSSVSYENCLVMVLDMEIHNIQDLLPLLQQIPRLNMPVLLISSGLVGQALHVFVTNHQRGVFKGVSVQAPSFGENRERILEDIAVLTGGQVLGVKPGRIDPKLAENDTEFWQKVLGVVASAHITKTSTTLKGGKGSTDMIKERADFITAQISQTESAFEREKLQQRVGNLTGGIAVLYVGGYSEVEVKEKKDRVDDALHATRAAVEGGIIPGGGAALLWAASDIRLSIAEEQREMRVSADQVLGSQLILKAIESPARQIVYNAGGSPDVVVNRIVQDRCGYNAHTGEFGDLVEQGVIDPVNVTISALRNAASVAGMLLTTSCSIITERSENPFLDAGIPNM